MKGHAILPAPPSPVKQEVCRSGIMIITLKKNVWGIQTKLLFALGGVALIPSILLLFLIYFQLAPVIQKNAGLELQERARCAADTLQSSLTSELKKLQVLTLSPALQSLLTSSVNQPLKEEEKTLIQNWQRVFGEDPEVQKITTTESALYLGNFLSLEPGLYRDLFLADSRSLVVASTRKPTLISVVETAWWSKIKRTGKPVFYLEEKKMEYQLAPLLFLHVALPVYSPKTPRFIGALHATLHFNSLLQFLKELELSKTGIAIFAAEKEKIYFSTRFSGPLMNAGSLFIPLFREQKSGWDAVPGPGDQKILRGFATLLSPEMSQETLVTPSHWVVWLEQPLGEVFDPLISLLYTTAGISLLIIIGAFYIGLKITRQIVHPLRRLQIFAHSVGLGALDRHLELDRSDEMQELADSFNQMVENLKKSKEEILAKTQALAQMNEELQRQNLMKGTFLSMVSHELRTPLTTLAGYVKFLMDGKAGSLNLEQYQCVTSAEKQVRHLAYLIDQLLNIVKIETGAHEVNVAPVYMPGVIHDCLAALTEKAAAKLVEFENHVDENLPLVLADRHQVLQIVTNLLHNAIKFSPEKGKVTLRGMDKEEFIEFAIKDRGPGIPPEFQQKVFEKFFRLEEGALPGERGLGLGLAIVKELVELNGGRIWVESKLGEGSEFFFILPKYARAKT